MASPMQLSVLVACIGCRAALAVQVAGTGALQAIVAGNHGAGSDAELLDDVTYLGSDLMWTNCVASYGGCQVDRAYLSSDQINIGGTVYPKGLFGHADYGATFPLGGLYNTFATCYGVALYSNNGACGTTSGEMDFTVYVDGVIVHWDSKKQPGEATCISYDVTGASTLEIRAGKSGVDTCDHAAFGDARLITTTPTATPTASPSASPTIHGVAAIGDPHLTNVRGRKLELHHTGNLTLLQIPKGLRRASSGGPPVLLRVGAEVVQKGSSCVQSYIERLNLTGKWIKEGERHYSADPKLFKPWSSGHKSLLIVGPGIRLVISHGMTDTGVSYLNFRAGDLQKLGSGASIGGLLGEGGGEADGSLDGARPIACGGRGERRGGTLGAPPAAVAETL